MRKTDFPLNIISVNQALLILLDTYRDDPNTFNALKKLFLMGAHDSAARKKMHEFLKDPALESYWVSFSAEVINEDPSRRYFETHLAYETLNSSLSDLGASTLRHSALLRQHLPKEAEDYAQIIMRGDNDEFFDANADVYNEYRDLMQRFHNNRIFQAFRAEPNDKILYVETLLQIAMLSTLTALVSPNLPLNIYHIGFFGKDQRGKMLKEYGSSPPSQNLGIMKQYMPLFVGDAAHSEVTIPRLKAADKASFVREAAWINDNFSRLVHPFSNSISGTILCLLRNLSKLRNEGAISFQSNAELHHFFKSIISVLLYATGGHTLHEYCAVLSLPEVKKEFPEFNFFDEVSEDKLFLENNEDAFNSALEKAIKYNKMLLKRKVVFQELESKKEDKKSESDTLKMQLQQAERILVFLPKNDWSDRLLDRIQIIRDSLQEHPSFNVDIATKEFIHCVEEAKRELADIGRDTESRGWFSLFRDRGTEEAQRTLQQIQNIFNEKACLVVHI